MVDPQKAPEWLRTALPVGSVEAWAAGAIVTAIATVAKVGLDAWAGEPMPPFITMYPAVVVAGLLGGPWVGLTFALLSLLIAAYFWVPEVNSFVFANGHVAIAVFAITGSFLGWTTGWARTVFDQISANEAERAKAARESVHRIKNLVAVVQAMTHKIAREVDSVEGFKTTMSHRLTALGGAQDVLLRRDWQDADLQEVIQSALAPFLPNPGFKMLPGPSVKVAARHVSGLSIALYELSTNAMNYGALANGLGPVNLSWRVADGACALEWRESLPMKIGEVSRSGLGAQLIQSALAREKGTAVNYTVSHSEVSAEFRWPVESAHQA